MFETAQIIQEHGQAKFAVIEFAEYQQVKELLSDTEKLEDYLDYLHIQKVKRQDFSKPIQTLSQVKLALGV
ncbi:MAG: hypothetical protein WCJ11_02915 [Methylococcaceae bacterium]|jgi:hypothetical protein